MIRELPLPVNTYHPYYAPRKLTLTSSQQPIMSALDPMGISSPLPSTPPELDDLPELSPTQYKSEAIVISSDSDSENEEVWRKPTVATNKQQQQHEFHRPSNPDLTPTRHQHHRNDNTNNSSPHEHEPAHTYTTDSMPNHMHDYTVLDHATSSPPIPNPPITVLLALTPQPANPTDQAAFEEFATRFSKDFSDVCLEEKWSCVSLYAHYREWAQRWQDGVAGDVTTSPLSWDTIETEIGDIHPSALVAKLEHGIDVHWRFFLPVLQRLIERGVHKGMRLFVVSGLKMGDVAGMRAFAQVVSLSSFMPVRCTPSDFDAD